LLFFSVFLFSQNDIIDIPYYSFIKYQQNKLVLPPDSSGFDSLFLKLNKLILKGEGQINILHIGDSHIQADFLSDRIREHFQTFFLGTAGSRGFVFPFKMIRSNNAFNFAVNYSGNWVGCRNVEKNKTCTLGLSGASATTTDSVCSFSVRLRKNHSCDNFNKVRVFHIFGNKRYNIETDNYILKQDFTNNDSTGYTLFELKNYTDSITFNISKTDTLQNSFTLYGLSLDNNDPGIIYHSTGVNGADFPAFNMCNIFGEQMFELHPDLIIVSLGTNDSYSPKWDREALKNNVITFIKLLKKCNNVPVVFATPCDNYIRRRYKNSSIETASEIIINTAKEQNCASWNLYDVMGGYGSMLYWYKSGLSAGDKLHFNKKGYDIQGDLFFEAFIKSYNNFIDAK